MKNKLILITFLISAVFSTACAQGNSSQTFTLVSIDSIPEIEITKIIYYSTPIEMKYNVLTNPSFTPVWYKAFCIINNMSYFNFSAKDAFPYLMSDYGITEKELQSKYDKVRIKGMQTVLIESHQKIYSYAFNEIWFSDKRDNTKYLLVNSYETDKPLSNLEFSTDLKSKNIQNERVDSIDKKLMSISNMLFKLENDTVKSINIQTFKKVMSPGRFVYPHLHKFKDMCYRNPVYYQSEMEGGKRVFRTMKKDAKGVHRVVKVNSKPE